MDQNSAPNHSVEPHESLASSPPAKKRLGNKTILVAVGIVLFLVLGGLLVFVNIYYSSQESANTATTQTTVTPKPTIPLTTEYTNPFDEKAQYENPFSSSESYKNPFDVSQ